MAKSKKHGYLLAGDRPMGAEHIARIFGESLERTSELLVELAQAGVYSMEQDTIFSRKMVKYEASRKSSRDRLLRWRNGNETKMKRFCNANETPQNTQNTQNTQSTQSTQKERAQVRPTLAQWLEYAKSIGWNGRDVQGAFDHYEANGWRVGGKAPVKDWQAAARNCFRRNGNHTQKQQEKKESQDFLSGRAWEPSDYWVRRGYGTHEQWYEAGRPSKSDLEYYETGIAEWPTHLKKFCTKGNKNGTI